MVEHVSGGEEQNRNERQGSPQVPAVDKRLKDRVDELQDGKANNEDGD